MWGLVSKFWVSKFPNFQGREGQREEGREGERANERLGTDHVISGPMSDLKKICTRWRQHPDGQTDMVTLRLNWPSEVDSVNIA